MDIEFDATKDAINIAKHGVSLADAAALDLSSAAVVADDRYAYGEARYRAYGLINGVSYCLAFTLRGDVVRAISLRRARAKEFRRYVN